jgi:predicted alpha-1,2-mannosidase
LNILRFGYSVENRSFPIYRRLTVFIITVFLLSHGFLFGAPEDLTAWVDPFIGTGKAGNTFPGALVPWGMVSVSPHNDLSAPSGYIHGQPLVYGFGHTHLSGMNCPDLGSLLLIPTVGIVKPGAQNNASPYGEEAATPGYYSLRLKGSEVRAEMTASTHCGFSYYTFPLRQGDANILIDASHRLTQDGPKESDRFEGRVKIVSPAEAEGSCESGDFCSPSAGNKQTLYFVVQFSKPALATGVWKGKELSSDNEAQGQSVGAFFRFSTAEQEPIGVKAGVSYVSVENARLNLKTEIPDWDFVKIRATARAEWNRQLSRVLVSGGSDNRRRVFYTALYHCLIHPSVFSDVNGEYPSYTHHEVQTVQGGIRYSDFPLWYAYRTLHPLLTLFYPEREQDMVKSLVDMTQEGGWLPRWELAGNETGVMVGCPAVPFITDAYMKGIRGFEPEAAFSAMVKSMTPQDNKLYGGLNSLIQIGYIPKDDDSGDWVWGSVTMTLDYSYDFWCLAQMAQALGHKKEHDDFIHRSGYFRNLYDPESGFLRPKLRDGSFLSPFDPGTSCCDRNWEGSGGAGYVEGNAWQYLFQVPQDLEGLKMLMGGDEACSTKLRELFDKGYYDPGKAADWDDPFLFDALAGQAWRTQGLVRSLTEKYFTTGPEGLPGNDEGGSLSAWLVFSSLGLYPLCPGDGIYALASPAFRETKFILNKTYYSGGNLTIKTINNSDWNVYVQSQLIDGVESHAHFIRHSDLTFGKSIVFTLGPHPAP